MRFIMQLIIFVIFVKISTKKLLLFSLRCRKGNHMARVISIVNQKGGTGKQCHLVKTLSRQPLAEQGI